MINKYTALFITLSLALLCLQPSLGAAKDKAEEKKEPAKEKPAPVYKGNYDLIESYGIYTKPKDGSLGRDLWSNTPRSAIVYWLKNSPDSYKNPIIQKLMFGTLLSKVNPRLIKNDISIKPGEDLLTLRLEKLLKMGAYTQASDLYSLAEEEAYHPALAYQGVLAMLHAGNKSIACLEVKTSLERFGQDKKLREISQYCDLGSNKDAHKAAKKALSKSKHPVLKAIAKNKKYKLGYSIDRFSTFAPLELAVLAADKRISIAPLNKVNLSKVPPRHLLLLLNNEDITPSQTLSLTGKAVYWGLLKPDSLAKLYKDADIPKSEDEDEDKAEVPSWLRIPALYQKMQNAAKGNEQWAILSDTFALGRTQGLHLLAPFAKDIRSAGPAEASLLDIHTALSVLLYAGEDIDKSWFKLVEKSKAENKSLYNSLLSTLYINLPSYKRDKALEKAALALLKEQNQLDKKNHTSSTLAMLIHNSHAASAKKTSPFGFYEKRFPLTSSGNYVMPTYQVWDRLVTAAQKGSIGETILLCANLLRIHEPSKRSDNNVGTIYPGLLRNMLNSLDNVGLTNVSKDLSLQVSLEQK